MKKFLLTLLFSLCLSFPAFANVSLLYDVEQSYQNMKNFKAEFNQELFHRESNTTQKRTGSIEFMPQTFIFWETNAPDKELIVCNEKEVWNYLPDEELAYRYSPKVLETSHAILNVITGQAKLEDNFEMEFISEDKTKNTAEFILYPIEANPQMVEVTLTINTKDKHIQKIVVLDFFGNHNTIEFTKFYENIKLTKSHFSIQLPKDVEIEDHFNDK